MHNDLSPLEQRWGMAVQSAGFGVWDLDPCSQTVHYSPQWKAMLGYGSADEADSTATWRARVHPDDLQPMLGALTDYLEGRAPAYETEFRLRAADDSYRWVLSRGRVVARDAQGRPLRMIGTLTDLTDRKEADALRVARDRAEAANRAKTEFLSRMSHELRTPLNAVLGFAQLLSSRAGTLAVDDQRRYVAHIEQAGWHLLTMIDDMLDLSRVESGQLAMQIEPVVLAPLVHTVCEMMGPMAQKHAVQVRPPVVPVHAAVRADAGRLKQVLTNLLSNAIKYNREGGSVTIDVVAAPQAWTLSVADTGIGIAAPQMAHLFEPFNRLGQAGSGIDGVGIGLVLTRWLVDRMGGRISVQSSAGIGSTFAVSLPAAAGAALPDAASRHDTHGPTAPAQAPLHSRAA